MNLNEQKIKEISDKNNSLENEIKKLRDNSETNHDKFNSLIGSKINIKEILNQAKNDQ